MPRIRVTALLFVALALVAFAAVTDRPPARPVNPELADHIREADARFKTTCNYSHRNNDDPIVFPGVPGAAHTHEFFGFRKTSPAPPATRYDTTTYAQLQNSGTTCNDAQDKAAYWAPAVLYGQNQAPYAPQRITAYYRRGNKHGTIQPYPDGLKIIAGPDPVHATWHCGHQDYPDPSFVCGEAGGWSMQITFPDCWDGVNVDSADHRSHMAYSVHDSQAQANVCDPAHPVPVPQLEVNVNFNAAFDGTQVTGLSSGANSTMHADFFNGWVRSRLLERIETCLNQIQVCSSGG